MGNNNIERRAIATPVTVRDRSNGGSITGIASVFNRETTIGGSLGWRERVAPGAFDAALRRPDDVRALWNHDPNVLLGRTSAGTLRCPRRLSGCSMKLTYPTQQQPETFTPSWREATSLGQVLVSRSPGISGIQAGSAWGGYRSGLSPKSNCSTSRW